MSNSVVVTGGAGFIGSHLVDRLVEESWRIKVIDNFSSGRIDNISHHTRGKVEIIKGDLKDLPLTLSSLKDVDTVFHYAANPEVRVSTTNPEIHFNENVVATFNLLEAMRKNDVKELIFASSSSVYGEPASIPVEENAPIKPVSVYGASKAACENLIYAYSRLYGIRALILRYANVVGPRLRHGVVYDFIMKLMKDPNTLEILGDGSQVRSYIYIDDAIDATLYAWRNSSSNFEVYNIGSMDWIDVNEVARMVTKAMGLNNVKYIYKPTLHGVGWPGDVKQIALDIKKLIHIGWKPKMKSREAIKLTAENLINELNR